MIPRKIHYIWFGRKPMNKKLLACLESWEPVFSEYKVYSWSEDNCPKGIFFLDEMLSKKQWAFASDFLRFYILYHHGGIYLDTDMFFYRRIDEYLNNEYFLGKEGENNLSAGVIGSVQKHPLNEICMNFYLNINKMYQIDEFLEKRILIPQVLNESYRKYSQTFEPILILEPEYFYPVSFKEREKINRFIPLNEKTKAIHLWVASWHNEYELINTRKYFLSLIVYFKNLRKSESKLQYSRKYIGYLYSRIFYLIKSKLKRLSKNNIIKT